MQITLEQLKEIAKAGYQDNGIFVGDNAAMNSKIYSGNNETEYALIDRSENILVVSVISDDYIDIDSRGFSFNHLAAIRKMEELGLIEK